MADSGSPLELCLRYRDAFFARDVEAILALVTPDFVFENVTAGERVEGIDAVRSHIASIHSRWPDMRFVELQVRDGRICRNAVYSSAHGPRPQASTP